MNLRMFKKSIVEKGKSCTFVGKNSGDIAGKNLASEDSFRQALYTAIDVYNNRRRYKEATANPLRKQYFDRGGDNEKLDLTKDEEDSL